MIQKKVCMLGAFAVGKTSLVRQFVESIFSEKYHTTVGVKVDKKVVTLGEQSVNMILWDLQGEDDFHNVRASYLRGASGHLIVADGTRRVTLETAARMRELAGEMTPEAPCILVVNKTDLASRWEIEDADIGALEQDGWRIVRTSAKTGSGVEKVFRRLAEAMTA